MRSKKAIKNIISSLLTQVATLICGFITPILIIEKYGSNVNGLMTSITQFLSYISLLDLGFGPVLKSVLYSPLAKKNKNEIEGLLKYSQIFFRRISYIFIIYIIILAIVYPLIVIDNFDFIFTCSLVLIISISTFFEYFFGITYKLFLQANQKTYVTSNIQLIFLILNTLMIVLLVKLNFSIHIVKLVSSLIFVLRPIVQSIYVRKKYNFNLKNATEIKFKQKFAGLSQHIAAIVHSNTDVVVLTFFSGDISLVSVYSVYYMVVNGIKRIIQSFTGGIDASFGDMYVKNEIKSLNKNFNIYELFFHMLSTIVFTCCIILIVPFVTIYSKNVSDINYVRPIFALLLVLSEFVHSIRLPYSSLTLAVGHFKETMIGAWIEAILNICISILLVLKFGLVGVAIGTLIAMVVRTFEFIYHTNKYVLNRSIVISLKKILVIIVQIITIMIISSFIDFSNIDSYVEWFIYAIGVFVGTSLIVVGIDFLLYKKDFMYFINILKRNIKKNKKRKVENNLKTYLITGGAGFIGSSLADKLLENNCKVLVIDNFCNFYDPKIKEENIKEALLNSNYKLYRGDIRDLELLDKIFSENKIDAVIHLAAMAGVRPSIEDPILYQEVNCMGTQNLLETMKKYNVLNLVMASSSSVYGNNKTVPFKETDIVDFAISPYAATKKANEVMTHVYHKLFNFNVIMLRFFTVYGPRQRPDLAINKFTQLMLNNEKIPMFGDGSTSRDYTYIDDIVFGIEKSIQYTEENKNVYEIINLGNSSPITLLSMINIIGRVVGINPQIEKLPMQPGDVERTYADISKAKKLLGYNPKTSFEKGIENFVIWYKNSKHY